MSKPDALRLAGDSVEAKSLANELGAMGAKLRDAERRIQASKIHCDDRVAVCDRQVDALTRRLTSRVPMVPEVELTSRPWFVAVASVVVTVAVVVPTVWLAVTR